MQIVLYAFNLSSIGVKALKPPRIPSTEMKSTDTFNLLISSRFTEREGVVPEHLFVLRLSRNQPMKIF